MQLSDWMNVKDDYQPEVKKAGLFKNKQVLTNLLAKLQTESKVSTAHRFHPVVYLTNVILVTFILCYSYNKWVIWLTGLYEGILLIRQSNPVIVKIVRRCSVLLGLNFILYFPAILLGNGNWYFLLKMAFVFAALITYATTTSVYDFLTAMKQLHVPDFIIFQVDIFIKHLHVLGNMLLQMIRAIEARSVGPDKGQFKMFGVIFGNLYLEMVKFGKELYNALEARAFSGKYEYMIHKLNQTDYLLIGIECVILIAVILV